MHFGKDSLCVLTKFDITQLNTYYIAHLIYDIILCKNIIIVDKDCSVEFIRNLMFFLFFYEQNIPHWLRCVDAFLHPQYSKCKYNPDSSQIHYFSCVKVAEEKVEQFIKVSNLFLKI